MDADTGRQCRIPAHAGNVHRHERGSFTRVAAPGQTSFPRAELLREVAEARRGGGTAELAEGPPRPDRMGVRRRKQAQKVAAAAAAKEQADA